MAEDSRLWNTDGVGDGDDAGITTAEMNEIFRGLFAGHLSTNLGGVRPDYLNGLAVSGTSSPVAVASGMAVVYGKIYTNSASVNVAIATPSVNPRIDRVVLRADWTAQTIRITRIAGSENVSPTAPALTQTPNTTWDIPLAQVHITTGGVITVTDEREWLTLVGNDAITFAKMQNIATNSLIGRDTASTGDPETILLNATLEMDGSNNLRRAALTGDVTASAGSNATTIANDAVTFAKMQNIATDSLIGRDTASSGDPENITLGASLSMNGSGVLQRAALTGDVTAAVNSNAMVIADDIIEYTDMRPQYANPIVVYSPGANQDFTTVQTIDFDTVSLDYDGPNLFSNDGAGVFTVAAACYVEVTVSGYVGHASGTTEAWCNVYIEKGTSGSSFSTIGKTGRIFYVPVSNWNSFHTACVISLAINEKIRVRIERSSGSDTLRLSVDSAIILKAIS